MDEIKTSPFSRLKLYGVYALIAGLILPLLGLIVNFIAAGGLEWDTVGGRNISFDIGLFGNFGSGWYFLIAAANGALLMLQPPKDKRIRLFTLYLKSAGFLYILYFLLIFLPIMPLGLIGIFFYGLGILIFAPLFAFLIQSYNIYVDIIVLAKQFSAKYIVTAIILGVATIPLAITAAAYYDKANFQTAVVYAEDYRDYPKADGGFPLHERDIVDTFALRRTMSQMEWSLDSSVTWFNIQTRKTPFISAFYTHIVANGRVLTVETKQFMENLFFDAGNRINALNALNDFNLNTRQGSMANLESIDVKTGYDPGLGVYKTSVGLTLKNNNAHGNVEYVTGFSLPEGVFISDYYLDVFETRKQGILADRRAATLIYQQIVRTRQDPGLLRYITDDAVELRVFPFSAGETRFTGFELLHVSDFELSIDGVLIKPEFNKQDEPPEQDIYVKGVALLSAETISSLPAIVREPEYYFVIDCSKGSDILQHINKVFSYAALNGVNPENSILVFASYKLDIHKLSDVYQDSAGDLVKARKLAGKYSTGYGFNLNRAVKYIMSNMSEGKFPIVITVTDNMQESVQPAFITGYTPAFAENPNYHLLNQDMTLTEYGYKNNFAGNIVEQPVLLPVASFNGICLQNDGTDKIIPMPPGFEHEKEYSNSYENEQAPGQIDNLELTGNRFKDALYIYSNLRFYSAVNNFRTGELANVGTKTGEDSLSMLQAAFRARVLTQQTAFLVVETAEQEQRLLELQEKILSGKYMSEGGEPVTMDEPNILILILLAAVAIIIITKLMPRERTNKLTT
jgi:hypothetical protein